MRLFLRRSFEPDLHNKYSRIDLTYFMHFNEHLMSNVQNPLPRISIPTRPSTPMAPTTL